MKKLYALKPNIRIPKNKLPPNGIRFTVQNPYAGVDWERSEYYKANLHTHTTASDGKAELTEMVEAYYNAGYGILALTDHGVINRGWNRPRETHGIFNGFRKVSSMSEADYERITKGLDRNGRGMTDITGGIECNMAVLSKTHVNGYFTEYGNGVWGKENDYRSAPAAIERAGGFSVLNHVGDWVNSNNYPERSHAAYFIAYFSQILLENKSCLGLEIVNNTDSVTRADRAFWDELLQVVIPRGRNIWGFANDDSERLTEVGRSFELFPLTENTPESVKHAMKSGAFFAASRYYKTDRRNETEGNGRVPVVKSITVDEKNGSITVVPDESRDLSGGIRWLSNGRVIGTDFTLPLQRVYEMNGSYIRFELFGAGGVTYSQPFAVDYEGRFTPDIPVSPYPNGVKGKLFDIFYHSLFWSAGQFIGERVLCQCKKIPKTESAEAWAQNERE